MSGRPVIEGCGRVVGNSVETRLREPIFIPMGGPKVHAKLGSYQKLYASRHDRINR